jgi:5'-nucleotidase (lipoprotein e(P4) family)
MPPPRRHPEPTVRTIAILSLAALAACGAPPPTTTPTPAYEPPSVENAAERHREVQWFRTAAEYRALALQAYRSAWDAVQELSAGREPGQWAVIMDADETVLDNSEFERRIAETGVPFEEEMWSEWVLEEAATAIPGATEFIQEVQSAGGRVAIVTNRDEFLCPATRRNLAALEIEPAVVLCETDTGEKEPRFEMVQQGTAGEGLPPMDVLVWIGDNIGDFPDLDQSVRDAPGVTFRLFGSRYFVLPNPMYGSWMGNEWR